MILLVPAWGIACLNDRDTLAFEKRNVDILGRISTETDKKKKTEAVMELALRAIGGRFERFQNAYYQTRIDRLRAQKDLTSSEYDDLAVAYDRIGKVDTAIQTILASQPTRKTSDDKYRFHANYGTFLVHRWIAQGKKETSDLKQSIKEIELAMDINPGSHFGREGVQLALQKDWLATKEKRSPAQIKVGYLDEIIGLSGIIMMGLGYELPDVYHRISKLRFEDREESIMYDFAFMRFKELLALGREPVGTIHPRDSSLDESDKIAYKKLREDGEMVHKARTAYIEDRLAKGKHPDTDSEFWNDWKEPEYPVLNRTPVAPHSILQSGIVLLAVGSVTLLLIGTVAIFIMRRISRA